MAVHLASGAGRFRVDVGMCVELREPLLHGQLADGEHEGLVAVISAAPIAGAELLGHAHLRQFLSVAEDAELGFPCEHFLAAEQADLSAERDKFEVAEDLFPQFVQGDRSFRCGCIGSGHGDKNTFVAKVARGQDHSRYAHAFPYGAGMPKTYKGP